MNEQSPISGDKMSSMRCVPRFRLRTIFVLIAVISIPLGWLAYQMNWIRQRHQFLFRDGVSYSYPGFGVTTPAPWSLRLLGEPSQARVTTLSVDREEAQRLFPEAMILPRD